MRARDNQQDSLHTLIYIYVGSGNLEEDSPNSQDKISYEGFMGEHGQEFHTCEGMSVLCSPDFNGVSTMMRSCSHQSFNQNSLFLEHFNICRVLYYKQLHTVWCACYLL